MTTNFISIGGWCGTKIALKDLGLFDEPSLPFDSVRSSIEGIIDCIENNFENFFPKEIKPDYRFVGWTAFIGEYVGFFHDNHNLLDENVIESFQRKIIRFDEKIKRNKCVFVRTIIREQCNYELQYYKKLQSVIDEKYPNLSYIICFIIPHQSNTQYYKHLDERTFLFTLNDKSGDGANLKHEYKPIYNFIINNDLFNNIPDSNDIEIDDIPISRLWSIDGVNVVNYIEK